MERKIECTECGLLVPESFAHPEQTDLCIFCALELEDDAEVILEEFAPEALTLEPEEL